MGLSLNGGNPRWVFHGNTLESSLTKHTIHLTNMHGRCQSKAEYSNCSWLRLVASNNSLQRTTPPLSVRSPWFKGFLNIWSTQARRGHPAAWRLASGNYTRVKVDGTSPDMRVGTGDEKSKMNKMRHLLPPNCAHCPLTVQSSQ